jgi:hypothetical protein
MEIGITLYFKNEQGEELLATLLSAIRAVKPDAFEFKVDCSGNAKRKTWLLKGHAEKRPLRRMGDLKRQVFEGLEKVQSTFLPMKDCAIACGFPTERIKSTVREALLAGQVERKMVDGVYVYRIAPIGLALLEEDTKLRGNGLS